MKIFRYFLCNIFFLLPIGAQALENQIASAGLGNMSCGDYLSVQPIPRKNDEVLTWLQGFMTGQNVLRIQVKKKLINIPNRDELYYSTIANCRQDPNETIFMTAAKMVKQYEMSEQMFDPTTSWNNKK
jgi:hypothetical protein